MSQADRRRKKMEEWERRKEVSRENRDEVDVLVKEVAELREELARKESEGETLKVDTAKDTNRSRFDALPISNRTKLGLQRGNYINMTKIQQEAIPHALAGRDVIGAARTGSGKTLAFVLPALELLLRESWTDDVGVGVLMLAPTRELALQIFKVLQVVGYKHTFSAALLTGGRNVKEEQKRTHAMNIIVGTPGRVLQHLGESAALVVDNLQLLVFDEADRILDMGFRDDITAIMSHLPRSRQCLMFSATQTTDVKALADVLRVKNPVYVSAHPQLATPSSQMLNQNFIVLDIDKKVDALYLFLKRHVSSKTIVFLSTCNQAKYMYLAFAKLLKKMKLPAMCLTGKMKQSRRDEVFMTFCRCRSAVLFTTDIAARGLDFPLVQWVLQYDCPDSVQQYIHRAGRTARAGSRGCSILMIMPSEKQFLAHLYKKNMPIREIMIQPHMLTKPFVSGTGGYDEEARRGSGSTRELFAALVIQGLKYEAQKAFVSYVRSVHFASNKDVFSVQNLCLEAYAASLGLPSVPMVFGKEIDEALKGGDGSRGVAGSLRSAKNMPYKVVNSVRDAVLGGSAGGEGVSRREKHLLAKDMFDAMEVRRRYERTAPGAREEENASDDEVTDGPSDGDTAGLRAKGRKVNLDEAEVSDNSDDVFFVKKPSTATAAGHHADASSAGKKQWQLSYEEKVGSLSKNKKKLLKSGDLRVADLHLAEHKKYEDDDEDESEAEETVSKRERMNRALEKLTTGQKKRGRSDDEEEDVSNSSSSSEGNDEDYTATIRRRVASAKDTDRERMKRLRKEREAKKLKQAKGEEAASRVRGSKKKKTAADDDDDDEEYEEDSDQSALSYDDDTMALLRAARGEMTSSDDDDEEDDDEEDDE